MDEKKKLHMVGWPKVTKPKSRGGLGLHAARERNTTLAAKLCWRMREESGVLWSKVLKFKYKRRTISSKAPKFRTWKAIIHGVAVCEVGSKWSLGNNSQRSFWDDKWLDLGTVRECIEGPLQKDEAGLRVCDIYNNGMWELHRLYFLLPPLLCQFKKATPIRTASSSEDHLSWMASPRGDFDPKGAYLIACGANRGDESFRGAWLWKLKTMPKIQMFLWKCYHNSIPVKSILAQRGIQISPTCDICQDQPETISHVLRECKAAQEFWAGANRPDELAHMSGLEVMEWIKANACCKVPAKGKDYPWAYFFLFGIWQLWLRRNKVMFQPSQSHQNLYNLVEAQVLEFWFCVIDHVEPRSRSVVAVRWTKPPENWVKLNTDGSVKGSPGIAGCGGLLRDCHGNWISGVARAIGITSSLAAELWAIRDGLTRCCHLSLQAVEVEVDASVAISLLSQDAHSNVEFSSLIDDCRSLMKNIHKVQLKQCFKEANRCADALAKFGSTMVEDFIVFESSPGFILNLLHFDKMGLTQDRVCNIVVDTT